MAGEIPSGEGSVFHFLDIFALGCGLEACSALFASKSLWLVAGGIVGAIGFHLLGTKWPAIKSRLGPRLALIIERIASDRRYRIAALVVVVGYFTVSSLMYVVKLRSDIDAYVIPRTLSDKQAHDLETILSKHQPFPVTVKVAVHDTEALLYSYQILNSFKRAKWENTTLRVTEHPDSEPPFTLGDGVSVAVVGFNAGPSDPKDNPQKFLEEAFYAAHIDITGGGGIGAGEYKVFILVGHRPIKLGDQQPLLSKIGHWMERLSQ